MSKSPQKLLIIGASARAAVQSARRAGFDVVAIDLFNDEDLRRLATDCFQIANFEHDLLPLVSEVVETCGPFDGWIYTGALENRPELIDSISTQLPLLGNNGKTLGQIRNPLTVHQILQEKNLPILDVRPANNPPPRDGTWLRKPLQSAAGRNIEIWDQNRQQNSSNDVYYFQRHVSNGMPFSSVFVAEGHDVRYIGSSIQLIGETRLGANSFTYCGSIGPLHETSVPSLPVDTQQQIQQTADCLTQQFQLVGLFGIDFLLKDSVAWPIEINPRYPASLEILERADDSTWVTDHVSACLGEKSRRHTSHKSRHDSPHRIVGKAILYANRQLVIPKEFRPFQKSLSQLATSVAAGSDRDNGYSTQLADIPAAGTIIPQGHPICTLVTSSDSLDKCRDQLLKESQALQKLLEVQKV